MSLRVLGIRLLPVTVACFIISFRITLNGQPACAISGGSDLICAGNSTTWSAPESMISYYWTGPSGFTAFVKDITIAEEGDYSLLISDANGESSCSRHLTVNSLQMTITGQPLPQTDCYGNHVEFSVAVSGSAGIVRYQWQQKASGGVFTDITGANSALLPVNNIGVNGENIDGTEYRAVISDDCQSITSNPAVLHINAITSLTPQVVNSTICSGGTISYRVGTQGTVAGFQWAFNNGSGWNYISDGGAYSGTTTSQLTISNATPVQSGSYRISVTFPTLNQPPSDPTCIETSFTRNRNLLVRPPLLPPVISSPQQICYGVIPAPLTATPATGGTGPSYTYQWQSSTDSNSWSAITGAISLAYAPPATQATTYYRLAATDSGTPSCGSVNSAPVAITVIPLPVTSSIYHR
jgi:hypothetical protein